MKFIFFNIAKLLIISSVAVAFIKSVGAEEAKLRLTTMEMPPYGFVKDDGQISGLFHEVNHAILQEGNIAGKIELLPLKRLMRGLTIGTQDCAILGNTDYVRKNYLLLEPLGKELRIGAIGKKTIGARSYDDLYDLNVGVAIGTKLWEKFDNDTVLRKTEVTNYQQGMIMLYRDRINVMTGVIESLSYLAKNIDQDFAASLSDPILFQNIELFYVCRTELEKDPRLQVLQNVVIKMRESGEIRRIVKKYLN
ncbi:substrate-binding periplasmic protein [Curvivirga sp.]|uniref:substrate-binding periplasmic protein n=1 Tax=Curvivirga sp. TaxID=2856848 RepID=UPI003B59ACB4